MKIRILHIERKDTREERIEILNPYEMSPAEDYLKEGESIVSDTSWVSADGEVGFPIGHGWVKEEG